jgi:hypothetical protein
MVPHVSNLGKKPEFLHQKHKKIKKYCQENHKDRIKT